MSKYAAKGALLQYENPPSTWVTIPGVQDFSVSLGDVEQIEVTAHDSGGWGEFVNGIAEAQPFTVPIVWDGAATAHAYLVTNRGGAAISMKVTGKETSPKVYTFNALVTNIELSWPVKGAQMANVTFKPTGAITVA